MKMDEKLSAIIPDLLDSRDFYEMCQQYRHSTSGVYEFEALKEWLRANAVIRNDPVNPT